MSWNSPTAIKATKRSDLEGKAMTVTETNYVWYLIGDVALIYAATLALKWIGDKVWWWYVGKVLGSRTQRHRRPPKRLGARL